uniref:Uncharacterized protein n=1 Tax=Aegilops tauschii subsp. strangulata TaxID=200361 RepID=A0A453A551_AEGTS
MLETQATDGWRPLLAFALLHHKKAKGWFMDGWRPLFSSRQEGKRRIHGWMDGHHDTIRPPPPWIYNFFFFRSKSRPWICKFLGQSPSMVCYSPCPSGSAKVSLAMRRRTQFPLSFFLSKRKETGHGPAPFRPPTKAQHHFARRPRPSTISPTDQGP